MLRLWWTRQVHFYGERPFIHFLRYTFYHGYVQIWTFLILRTTWLKHLSVEWFCGRNFEFRNFRLNVSPFGNSALFELSRKISIPFAPILKFQDFWLNWKRRQFCIQSLCAPTRKQTRNKINKALFWETETKNKNKTIVICYQYGVVWQKSYIYFQVPIRFLFSDPVPRG